MEYTNYILFALGFLGILMHNLVKVESINRQTQGNFKIWPFIKLEWPSIFLSLCVVFVCLIAKSEIKQLEAVGSWLGLSFVAIGYMAQSLIYTFIGKVQKIIDKENKQL